MFESTLPKIIKPCVFLQKVGAFKTDSSSTTVQYDKYGREVGSYKLKFLKNII